MSYEIDNSKQDQFITVMKKLLKTFKECFPNDNCNYFFKWKDELIEKVFYFFEFENEESFNDFAVRNQRDPRWIHLVITDYHSQKFVTPNTVSLEMVHEIGQDPLPIQRALFDYDIDNTDIKEMVSDPNYVPE